MTQEMRDKINSMPNSYCIEDVNGRGFSYEMSTKKMRIYSAREKFIELSTDDIGWLQRMINDIKNNISQSSETLTQHET